jgi:hypothetical protein
MRIRKLIAAFSPFWDLLYELRDLRVLKGRENPEASGSWS